MPVRVSAFVTVKPGHEDAFVVAARKCIEASRDEGGVLNDDLWPEVEDDRRFVFDELYVDDAAVQAHIVSDHFKTFGAAARDLAAASPSITVTDVIDVAT